MLKYPDNFMTVVKREYPHKRKLHSAIKEGREVAVGSILKSLNSNALDPELMITLIDANNTNVLRRLAITCLRRRALYEEWCKIISARGKSQ